MITPGVVALVNDIGTFTPDLRDASLYLAYSFGAGDVLLSTGGVPEKGVDRPPVRRLCGAGGARRRSLSQWQDVDKDIGCDLVAGSTSSRIRRSLGDAALARTRRRCGRLHAVGFVGIRTFGQFVVGRCPLRRPTRGALSAGVLAYRVAGRSAPTPPISGAAVGLSLGPNRGRPPAAVPAAGE